MIVPAIDPTECDHQRTRDGDQLCRRCCHCWSCQRERDDPAAEAAGRAAYAVPGAMRRAPYAPPAGAMPGSPDSTLWACVMRAWYRGWDSAAAEAADAAMVPVVYNGVGGYA